MDWPSNGVGSNPETGVRDQTRKGAVESCGVDRQEKPVAELVGCPYRKPTQVGEASSLR